MASDEKIISLLAEIRDSQKEALELQRQHIEYVRSQYERTKAIQDRAEAIQDKSAWLINASTKTFKIILPIIVFLIAVVLVMMFML